MMTFIQKLKFYKDFIISRFVPQQRLELLRYYSFLELPGEPELESGRVWYRLINKSVMLKQAPINLRRASEKLLQQQERLPLVSCLMVTKNRFLMAKKAVHCFVEQTYTNRELIIVDDGSDTQLKDLVTRLQHPKIRFFHLPDESKKLGVLRNLSRQYAKGTFLAQWDDDDLSHRDRLLFQMTLIQKHGLDGCSLQREQLWFPAKNRFGFSTRRLWEGSMVANKEKLRPYCPLPLSRNHSKVEFLV